MIKICFYSHTVDFAGTWRSHEKIFENLDRTKFDPYIMFWDNSPNNNRLEILKKKFGEDRFIPFKRSLEKIGVEKGYSPVYDNFAEIAKENKFDIIHFARSGYFEWPFVSRIAKLQIETNIFGAIDDSPFLDKSISISKTVYNRRSDCLIYNPITIPETIEKDYSIRRSLNIPDDHIVLGRVGRADNFTPIALHAYKLLELNGISNVHYLIVSPCENTKFFVSENSLKNVHFFEPTNDDAFLDLFHKNLDVYAHYRSDGEVHSVAISSAMSYGLPIISHYGGYNGQKDTIANGGFVVSNHQEYFEKMLFFISQKKLREEIGFNARKFVVENFEEKKIVKQIENKYLEWLK